MVTLADIQRLVEADGATVHITIAPLGFPHQVYSKEGDTICVSAGNSSQFYGSVVTGRNLETCMLDALKKAPKTKKPLDLADLL